MKTVYNVEMKAMNGTVTMITETWSFTDKELAVVAAQKLAEVNKGKSTFNVIIRDYESVLYENLEEVPILNNEEA